MKVSTSVWTNTVLADLGLPADHKFAATDLLNQNEMVTIGGGAVGLENQPPQSVRVIKLIDTSVPAAAPTVDSAGARCGKYG